MLDLKDFFLEMLGKRIEALEQALDGTVTAGSENEATIRHVAHGVRGAGGTYGFPELSQLAERVDLAPFPELPLLAAGLLEELRSLTRASIAEKGRVLLIEGDDDDAGTLAAGLARGGRSVRRSCTATEAVEALAEGAYDTIVFDIALPEIDGRSFLLRLREQFQTAEVPVIVVAGHVDTKLQTDCYQLGAVQVFQKPVAPEVLSAATSAAIERAAFAHRVSTIDPLTGLPNRAGFHEMLQRSVSMCARTGEPLSVTVLDIDRFKSINDIHGHLLGDEVLRRVAELLKQRTRKSDYVARWGGEEFVALFHGSSAAGATIALERLLEGVRTETFCSREGKTFGVTFSAGVADVQSGSEPVEAIAEADRLLYSAKAAGRDRVVNPRTVLAESRASVLLAEDDELVAAAVARTLQPHGYDVVHVTDSETTLEIIHSRNIALCILDVNMPGTDGFELLANLRSPSERDDLPVIMLTARGAERDVVRGFELGADDYIVKPFSPPELAARVHRLARRR